MMIHSTFGSKIYKKFQLISIIFMVLIDVEYCCEQKCKLRIDSSPAVYDAIVRDTFQTTHAERS